MKHRRYVSNWITTFHSKPDRTMCEINLKNPKDPMNGSLSHRKGCDMDLNGFKH